MRHPSCCASFCHIPLQVGCQLKGVTSPEDVTIAYRGEICMPAPSPPPFPFAPCPAVEMSADIKLTSAWTVTGWTARVRVASPHGGRSVKVDFGNEHAHLAHVWGAKLTSIQASGGVTEGIFELDESSNDHRSVYRAYRI